MKNRLLKKGILSIVIVFGLVTSLVGCDNKKADDQVHNEVSSTSEANKSDLKSSTDNKKNEENTEIKQNSSSLIKNDTEIDDSPINSVNKSAKTGSDSEKTSLITSSSVFTDTMVNDKMEADVNAGASSLIKFDFVSSNESAIETEKEDSSSEKSDGSIASTGGIAGLKNSSSSSALDSSTVEFIDSEEYEEEDNESLSSTQRNSVNMLNYMTVLTEKVNSSKGNQLYLESAYSSLVNNIYPNSVDTKTQNQITSLMDTIEDYRMISVKRDRLEFIYEQNKAQAIRQAIPNPIGLLSAVESGSKLKVALAVIYMAADSVTSYTAATSQADLQFIKDGWELDDAEAAELHNSTKNALSYMFNMVRDYQLPGDYALNQEYVEDFVTWSQKPDSQLVNKIEWLKSHEGTYKEFGPYWLELAKDYYNDNDYQNCLKAVEKYENVSTRIFRKDFDYAKVLPMAIISAEETMSESRYVSFAEKYCQTILDNTKDSEWSLRYFVAQIYIDLFAKTNNSDYLDKAYKIAFDNVNVLVDEQKTLNMVYTNDIQEVKADKDATKREKKEIKQYNKTIKAERKTALPPVNEALYLNCDLLFALANQKKISDEEKNKIDAILHENNNPIFMTESLDSNYWFNKGACTFNKDSIDVSFDGKTLTVPASCITDRSVIRVRISGNNGNLIIVDWTVDKVVRPKGAGVPEFKVIFKSKKANEH